MVSGLALSITDLLPSRRLVLNIDRKDMEEEPM
jgi:hypothetical protein